MPKENIALCVEAYSSTFKYMPCGMCNTATVKPTMTSDMRSRLMLYECIHVRIGNRFRSQLSGENVDIVWLADSAIRDDVEMRRPSCCLPNILVMSSHSSASRSSVTLCLPLDSDGVGELGVEPTAPLGQLSSQKLFCVIRSQLVRLRLPCGDSGSSCMPGLS